MADIAELRAARLKKARKLEKLGSHPYPETAGPRMSCEAIRSDFSGLLNAKKAVQTAGRIVGLRPHGALIFLDLKDETGRLQLILSRDQLSKELFQRAELLDVGDFVTVVGALTKTKRGEESILAQSFRVLAKSLRPLPSSWYGLRDVDERFRNREVDLLLNETVAGRFRVRSALIRALRNQLDAAGFLEVETPVLQPVPGGAHAEPFKTILRALRLPLYLRIAPELYLKRLLVGGFEKVFELGRAFRNEGMDQSHNPEFTILEFYWAYQNLEGLADFSEKLLCAAAEEATGSSKVVFREKTIDFKKRFARYSFSSLFQKHIGLDVFEATDAEIRSAAQRFDVSHDTVMPRSAIIDHLFKKAVVATLIDPTFIFQHPLDLSPLAKADEKDPRLAARFQILAGGMEIVNAYAELNDPIEQRRRFLQEQQRRRRGHKEAQRTDEDFLTALEYGMPPAAGFGLGVDRFAMLLTDAPSLREIIFFPTMRPKKKQ